MNNEKPISRAVWKYRLERTDENIIKMPRGAIPRRAIARDGELWLWVEVDTTLIQIPHLIQIVGTGHETIRGGTYVDTMFDGPYVWHVYWHGEVEK